MQEPIQQYCEVMEEIKRRTSVLDYFLFGGGHALFEPTTLESISLQIRKILELIAFASLVANRELYAAVYAGFAKEWNAGELLKKLAKVNPNFYPQPIVEVPSQKPGVKNDLKPRTGDFLSRDNFAEVYGRCGEIMHAANPLGAPIKYEYYRGAIPSWRTGVINLLNCHKIQLLDETWFYLVHVKEHADDRVHYYKFQRVDSPV